MVEIKDEVVSKINNNEELPVTVGNIYNLLLYFKFK